MAMPQIFSFAEDELKPEGGHGRSDVFFVQIDSVRDEEDAQLLTDLIVGNANQPPLAHRRNGEIDVDPDAISPLPTYQDGSAIFQKVMLVFLEEQQVVTGFIFCGRAPHPHADHFPPEDHHCPPTFIRGSKKIYSGLKISGYGTVTETRVDRVKEELVACASTRFNENDLLEDITVRAIRQESQFITKLKCNREALLAGVGPRRIFDNNQSIWKLREVLLDAVHGDHDRYYENEDGGIVRFNLYSVSFCLFYCIESS